MTTELRQLDQAGNTPDTVALLMEEPTELGEWSRHNDPKLSDQKNVLNLDNRHVRLTLWCLVYVILTTTQMANNMYAYIYYDDDQWWTPSQIHEETEYYSLGISTNSILWFAVCIFLCSLYCAHCKCDCNGCTVFLFVVGSIMSFVTMVHGTQKECKDIDYFPYDTDFVGYCRSLFIGSAIFLASFSMYLACDIMKSVGDAIRVRLCVKSLFISLRSFLLFAYWNKELNLLEFDDDDAAYYYSVQFAFRTLSGGLLICGIVCSIILILLGIGYGSDGKKIHPFVARLLAFFLLSGVGSTMVIGLFYADFYVQTSSYYVVAAVLVAYDLQYL